MRDGNTQGKRTKEQIIQVAIGAFAEKGAHGVTLQEISERLQIKRSHLVYHFKDTSELFRATWECVYGQALLATEERMAEVSNDAQRLTEYLRVSVDFFTSHTEFTRLYFQLHYMAVFSEQFRVINTSVKQRAVQRIAKMIMDGQSMGEFRQGHDPYLQAKAIHSGLVGIILNSISEHAQFSVNEILEAYAHAVLLGLR